MHAPERRRRRGAARGTAVWRERGAACTTHSAHGGANTVAGQSRVPRTCAGALRVVRARMCGAAHARGRCFAAINQLRTHIGRRAARPPPRTAQCPCSARAVCIVSVAAREGRGGAGGMVSGARSAETARRAAACMHGRQRAAIARSQQCCTVACDGDGAHERACMPLRRALTSPACRRCPQRSTGRAVMLPCSRLGSASPPHCCSSTGRTRRDSYSRV